MADRIVLASPGKSTRDTELLICIGPGSTCRYEGTRAQLETEIGIPAGVEWPKGVHTTHWTSGKVSYQLSCAARPGSGRQGGNCANGDYWQIRTSVMESHRVAIAIDQIDDSTKALTHLASEAGWQAFQRKLALYLRAKEDSAFQAFKSKCLPEQKKRGRKPKSNASTQEAGHA